MCLPDTPGRLGQGVFARAHGEATTDGPAEAEETPASVQKSIAVRLLRGLVHAYRLIISPCIGPRCRFLPTCSDYALDALARHGAIRGGWLTLGRLARCHPLGGSGFDPVPTDVEESDQRPASAGKRTRQELFGHRRPEPNV